MRKRKGFSFFIFFCLPYISARIHTIFNLILGSLNSFYDFIIQGRDSSLSLSFSLSLFLFYIFLPSLFFCPGKTLHHYVNFVFISLSSRSFLRLCISLYNCPSLIYIILPTPYFFFSVSLSSHFTLPFFSLDLVFSVSPINTEGIALIIYPQILLCSTVAIKFIYIFINKISGRMSIIIQ